MHWITFFSCSLDYCVLVLFRTSICEGYIGTELLPKIIGLRVMSHCYWFRLRDRVGNK